MSLSRKPLKVSVPLEWGTSEHISESDNLGIDATESELDDVFGGHCQTVIIMFLIYFIFKNSCITYLINRSGSILFSLLTHGFLCPY